MAENIKQAIDLYVQKGIPTDSCTEAILSNDLFGAYWRADASTRDAMFEIVSYVQNKCPAGCHGGREIYSAWLKMGGLQGVEKDNG